MKNIKNSLTLFTIFLISALFSTTLYAEQYNSSWGSAPWTWPNGSTNETIILSPTLNVNFNIAYNGEGSRSLGGITTPAIDDAAQLSQFGGIPDLGIVFAGAESVVSVMTFSQPVYNASFLISDIDNYSARIDQVVVTSDVGTPSMINVNDGAGDTISSIIGNTASSSLKKGAQRNNDLGSVRVSIPDGSTVVTITYNDIGTASTRGIGILGTLSFTDKVLPDYEVSVTVSKSTFINNLGNFDLIIRISELLNGVNNGDVLLSINKDNKMTLDYNPDLITLDGKKLDNANWEWIETAATYSLKYIGTNTFYPASKRVYLGLSGVFTPPKSVKSDFLLKVKLKDGSGDTNSINNEDLEVILYSSDN